MKKFSIILSFLAFAQFAYSEPLDIDSLMANMPDRQDNIILSTLVTDETSLSEDAIRLLKTKMNGLITHHGIIATDVESRFFLASEFVVTDKDILPGVPTKISETIQCNFIIGDTQDGLVFSSLSVSTKGSGDNENKAMVSAVKSIKWNNEVFDDFINEAKEKIVDYYTKEAPIILQKVQQLTQDGQYEEAIGQLVSLPTICPQYRECMQKALEIYQIMVDNQAETILRQAKAEWASSPDRNGADRAIAYIADFPSDSRYDAEMDAFIAEINSTVSKLDKEEREFQRKMYVDSVLFAQKMEREKMERKYAAQHRSGSSSTGQASAPNVYSGQKWGDMPVWKKVLVGGGVALAAKTIGSAMIARSLLSRTVFHVVKVF